MENYIVSKTQLEAIANTTRYKSMVNNRMLVTEIPAYISRIAGGGTSYVFNGNFGFDAEIAIYNKKENSEEAIIEQINSIFAFPIGIMNKDNILICNFEIINS